MDYSLADLRAATEGTDGMFGGNGLWFLAILFLFGNGGFGWGGRGGNPVTEADLCTSQNFNNLQNAVGRLSDNQAAIARQNDAAICQIGYQNLQNTSALSTQMAECCCGIERNLDGVNYNVASQAAAINANTTAQVQKVLDAICGNRMADMQNQINQLQLQSALCGVVRYPTSMSYTAGYSPFCGYTGCGCPSI